MESNESYYDKYFMQFWYCLGYIVGALLLFNPNTFEKAGWFLPVVVSFGLAVPSAFLLFTAYTFVSLMAGFLIDGIKDKNFASIFAAFWILVSLTTFIMKVLGNA